ncbi:MAG: hypothetical protein GXO09_00170 [Crenarchaeota archaeon]|nr:hypothetical protein [Thermoproteota archaeon]
MGVVIRVDLARYKYVDLEASEALKLLSKIAEVTGKRGQDLDEAERYIRNFDEFYEYMQKKFKDYIAPPKRTDDYIRGLVVVDKLKLYKKDGEKRVVIVFDRRISVDDIKKALEELGYKDITVEKMG